MSGQTDTKHGDRARTLDEPPSIIHTFPDIPIKIGDIALCGSVKTTSRRTEDIPPHRRERCVVCVDLTGCP